MNNNYNRTAKIDMNEFARELGCENAAELSKRLDALRSMPVKDIDPESVVELTEIEIDNSLPVVDRVMSLLRQTKNPYGFKYNGMIVKTSFAGKRSIEDCLAEYFFSN